MPDVSIAISAKDNFSGALRKMSDNTKPFSKDVDLLQNKLSRLSSTRASLKVDLSKTKRELKTAQQEFDKLGDAGSRAAYELKQQEFDQISRNIKLLGKEASSTERKMLNMTGALSKAENRAGNAGMGSMMGQLGQAGAFQFAGQAAAQISGTLLSSALGQPMATAVSTALSGAASGAAIGSMIAPGVGTAIGAGVGALVGTVQGAAQVFENQDEAFKSYVQEQTEGALAERQQNLTSGSGIAAQRETDLISFSTLFGDKAIAQNYLSQVKTMANVTPFLYGDLTSMSKTLKTFGYGLNEMLPKLTAIGDTGAALGLSTSDMEVVATALGRMKSGGKTSLEYVNMLQERGIDAVGALAAARGSSSGQVYEDISGGSIHGADADRIITEFMQRLYGGAMEMQSRTFAGLSSTLEGLNQEQQNAMGDGYNEGRKGGMGEQIDWLSGENGRKMEDANRALGAWQAELENSREQHIRDAQAAALESAEYIAAANTANDDTASPQAQQQAWADMGEILARAKVEGVSAYNASEGAQIALESELSLAAGIREDAGANAAYWDAGYKHGQTYSRGLAAAMMANSPLQPDFYPQIDSQQNELASGIGGGYYPDLAQPAAKKEGSRHAYGLGFVPKDDYPALLHYGERVLTANQARQQDAGGAGGGVSVQVYGMTVREEADVERVAEALHRKLRTAKAAAKPI